MDQTGLKEIAQHVINRAQRQGYVVPREIREELVQGGLSAARWKDVVQTAGPRLGYRKGRYYFVSALTARVRLDHHNKQEVSRAANKLIRRYKTVSVDVERRFQHRIHFIQPVKVLTNDRGEFHLLSQDISLSGIRMIGTCDLRDQRVRILIPTLDKGGGQWCFTAQMLWSAAVGDNLIENGGIFLEVKEEG